MGRSRVLSLLCVAALDDLVLESTREDHRQSDEHWTRFKSNVEEASETE